MSEREVKIEAPWRVATRRFRRHRMAVVSLVLILVVTMLAIGAPLIAQHDPSAIDLRARNEGPSLNHWFGTDRTGRDSFARTVYAGQVSLMVGVASVVISIGVGALLGALAGYRGGFTDSVIMRFTDVMMTFPPIIVILTVAAITGPGLWKTIVLIGLLTWPIPCRLVRARFLLLRNLEFVHAARVIGAADGRIMLRHAFPNVIDVLIVNATLGVAAAILLEAGLSFLGLGVQPPTPSWGNMLNVARNISTLENDFWQWAPAGIAIVLCVLAINFIGDGLREALDPRL
ncbi:MAG: ABC transporter permease [Chloroflexota bacterium]|nr:ABC transporter permease [Chloroflexota bacterium]